MSLNIGSNLINPSTGMHPCQIWVGRHDLWAPIFFLRAKYGREKNTGWVHILLVCEFHNIVTIFIYCC